jgi:hypothetical protein
MLLPTRRERQKARFAHSRVISGASGGHGLNLPFGPNAEGRRTACDGHGAPPREKDVDHPGAIFDQRPSVIYIDVADDSDPIAGFQRRMDAHVDTRAA